MPGESIKHQDGLQKSYHSLIIGAKWKLVFSKQLLIYRTKCKHMHSFSGSFLPKLWRWHTCHVCWEVYILINKNQYIRLFLGMVNILWYLGRKCVVHSLTIVSDQNQSFIVNNVSNKEIYCKSYVWCLRL